MKKLNKIFIGCFLILLILPNMVMLSSYESDLADNEKTNTNSLDLSGNILQKIQKFKIYYKSNFGLKKTLTNQYLDIKTNHLKESPIPHKVVVGNQGWYFLGDDYSTAFSGSNGSSQYTYNELNTIVNSISEIKDWLDSQGIAFYLAIPPNKHTVYKEHLPLLYNNKTKYDVILDKLKSETDINIIDLKTPLLKGKDSIQIYHKTDSHWNDIGAFIGYSEVMNELGKDFEELKPTPLSYYSSTVSNRKHKEMTRMINLNITEKVRFLSPKVSQAEVLENNERFSHFRNEGKPLSIYFCRDSFSNAWIKYFNESFGETMYAKTYRINKNELLKHKPDIVVLEFVERKFDYFLKYKNPILY